jgi:pimeloyl-ACP methyl ester carboxylesterase
MMRYTALSLVLVSCLVAPPLRAQDTSFDSKGVKIHYVVEGKGEPVVLIHGFAADVVTNWSLPGILQALAKDYQVIAFDCRGHGQSGRPHDAKQYGKAMADDVARLLDHLKIKKAHIVGYSMGGGIAMVFAMEYPERTLSATIGGFGLSTPRDHKDLLKNLADSLENGKGFGPLFDVVAGKKMSPDLIKAADRGLLAVNDAKALVACLRGFQELASTPTAEMAKKLRAAKRPLLALIGDDDPFKPGAVALKKAIPETELVLLKDADHFSAIIDAGFTPALKAFLKKHQGQK